MRETASRVCASIVGFRRNSSSFGIWKRDTAGFLSFETRKEVSVLCDEGKIVYGI